MLGGFSSRSSAVPVANRALADRQQKKVLAAANHASKKKKANIAIHLWFAA
jgi:hypothetical protein